MAMAKHLRRGDELGIVVLEDSEKNTEVSRDNIGIYRIVKKYPSMNSKDSARVEFKDKGTYIDVNVAIRDYLNGERENNKRFYVMKKDASIRLPEKTRHKAEIVYGDGRIAGESWHDKHEMEERASIKHLHKIAENHAQEKKIYHAILEELDKIKEFEKIGTLLHEFHEHAEKEFYNKMESKTPEDNNVDFEILPEDIQDSYGKTAKKKK